MQENPVQRFYDIIISTYTSSSTKRQQHMPPWNIEWPSVFSSTIRLREPRSPAMSYIILSQIHRPCEPHRDPSYRPAHRPQTAPHCAVASVILSRRTNRFAEPPGGRALRRCDRPGRPQLVAGPSLRGMILSGEMSSIGANSNIGPDTPRAPVITGHYS